MKELLKGSPAEKFIPKLPSAKKGRYWVYNEANLLRQLSVYKWGGVYLDTDIYLVRPLYSLRVNGAGWQDSKNSTLNNAFLMFEKGHPFVKKVMEDFVKSYRGDVWGNNGPRLVSKVWKEWRKTHVSNDKHAVKVYKYVSFYMIHYSKIKQDCFETTSGNTFNSNTKLLHTQAYGLHVNAKITGHLGISGSKIKKGTLCSHLFNEHCVLCDHTY